MKESLLRLTAVPLPFQGRLICQRRKKIKVAHLHKKTLEYQHYQYRQGQPPALASPRRTARYERIPPDGFDMAALEVAFHGKTPPPASLVPLPFQGRLICQRRKKIKVAHLHKKTSEYQHYRYRQGQQPALASPRRTARATSDSAERFRHGCTRKSLPSGKPAGRHRPYLTPYLTPAAVS